MVSAVSGTSIAVSVLSSSTSSSTVSELKAQIAEKQSELSQATGSESPGRAEERNRIYEG